MNTELKKFDTILKSYGFTKNSYSKLSEDTKGNPLVSNTNLAYSFDDISNSFYLSHIKHSSCDCLLIKDSLYLVEFKRLAYTSNKCKYKLIKQNIAMKISESLHTLEKKLFNVNGIDTSKFEKVFILVVDSTLSPIPAISGVMANLANISPVPVPVHNDGSLLQCLSKYESKDRNNNITYFNKIRLVNDINFSAEITSLT